MEHSKISSAIPWPSCLISREKLTVRIGPFLDGNNHHELTGSGGPDAPDMDKAECAHDDSQPFLFVNATALMEKDVSVKVIRSHVRKKHIIGARRGSKPESQSVYLDRVPIRRRSLHGPLSSQLGQNFVPFASYPVPMQPHM
jgi:hypothetical protein